MNPNDPAAVPNTSSVTFTPPAVDKMDAEVSRLVLAHGLNYHEAQGVRGFLEHKPSAAGWYAQLALRESAK